MPDKKAKSRKLATNSLIPCYFKWRFSNGFTLIELLVVITLMAIVGASVSAAYLGFENRQRVKEAALTLENGIRASQNNASSGKNVNCASGLQLIGWFFGVAAGSNLLSYGAYCQSSGGSFDSTSYNASLKTFNLPQGVTVIDVKYGPVGAGTTVTPIYVFYRTLSAGCSFHTILPDSTHPYVNSATGDLINLVGTLPQDPVTIILSGSGVTYGVVVMPSGEVYETQM